MPSNSLQLDPDSHLHFVTGRLAENAVREVVESLSQRLGFDYSVAVMPITVAALMTPKWLIGKWTPPPEATHLIVPGFCASGQTQLQDHYQKPVVIGPKDCRDMAVLFGEGAPQVDLDAYTIEIIAEINHAPQYTLAEIIDHATRLTSQGADRIDIGCDPGTRFDGIADCVTELVDRGMTVSVDTFDPLEAAAATAAGADLVLSVNSTNRHHAVDWQSEVVVIPDTPTDLSSMDETIEFLSARGVRFRVDPILEPIGAGLAASLVRYSETRRRYPDVPMMMGIGNLTELSDVDSAGVNLMLLGICQELRIDSVLTTQVINWARSSVRECDHGRRLAHAAVRRGVPPKNLSDALVMLRDPAVKPFSAESLQALAESIKDNNYRLFAQDDQIHLISRQLLLSDPDPFALFDRLLDQEIADNVDRGHAFYLGYEMAKASIALVLGKQYEQDRALRWGLLTQEEDLHRIRRTSRHRDRPSSDG